MPFDPGAQLAKTEVMGQQFLEGQPLLRGMMPRQQLLHRRIGGRAMHITQGLRQGRQVQRLQDLRRQPFLQTRRRVEPFQGLLGQTAQSELMQSLGGGIDGGQVLLAVRREIRGNRRVFGMDHLQGDRPAAHLAETAQPLATLQSLVLLGGKMEEAQRQAAGAVTDADQQHSASAALHLAVQHLAVHHHLVTGTQRADGHDLGTVLITGREVKQQILDGLDTQLLQAQRQTRAHALEIGNRRRQGAADGG